VQSGDITGTLAAVRQESIVAHPRTTVSSKWDVNTAFAYMADFSNSATWDPGVASAHQVGDGDVGQDTKFELLANFNGRQLPLTYEVTAFDPPHRMVLRADTDMVLSIDEITFTPRDGGTDVTYDADLRTRGWFQLAASVVALMFKGIGDHARAGLQSELNV
jgi:uncharacterized protein YndB with AHSA1/START domain